MTSGGSGCVWRKRGEWMAQRGTPLPMKVRLEIKQRTAAGSKIKPLARELGVDAKTARKYRARA